LSRPSPKVIPDEIDRNWCGNLRQYTILRKRFNDLLCGPDCRGVFSDIEVEHSAPVMREDYEDIQHTKLDRRNREEIDRYHLAHMIAEKTSSTFAMVSYLFWHQS
jgi:hypothetical protein